MSAALQNHLISITAPKGVIPDLSQPRRDLTSLADFFNALAIGNAHQDSQIDVLRGATDAASAQPYAVLALATCAALTGVKINGVTFTALATGTANATYNQFTISGSDAEDATALVAAINVSASAGVAGVVQACNLSCDVTLAAVVAGDFLTLAGVKLTATQMASDRNNTFTMSGTDTVDGDSLAATINAHPYLRRKVMAFSASGVVTLRQKSGTTPLTISSSSSTIAITQASATITFATPIAGTSVIIAGKTFTGVTGATGTALPSNFSVDTSDTAAGDDLVTQIAANTSLASVVTATNSSGTVTIKAKTTAGTSGNGIPLVGTVTVAAASAALLAGGGFAADSELLVTTKLPGVIGNGLLVEPIGIQASTTATCVDVVITDTLVVNGQTFTAIQQSADGTITPRTAIAGNTCVVAGVTFTGVAGATGVGKPVSFSIDTSDAATATDLVTQINAHPVVSLSVIAALSTDVVVIRARAAGTAGNAIVMGGTVTTLAFANGGTLLLAGGIAVANNQFDVSPGMTNTEVAADLVRAINASTTTLVSGYVRASNLLGVVTVYSLIPGTAGNGITLVSTGGTITVAAARLAGATIATAEGVQASCTLTCATVLNTNTVTINGVVYTGHTNTESNDQFSVATGNTETAASLCKTINNSTTAGSAEIIATSSGAVVTVKARRGGIAGNLITVAVSAATVTISGSQTRLISGAVPVTVTGGIQRLAGGVGGNPAVVYSYP